MSKTLISVKVDKHIKDQAKKVAREMGLPLSAVINNQLRRLVQERRAEFIAPHKMSKKLERELAQVEKDIRLGRNISPPFSGDDTKAMDRWLGV